MKITILLSLFTVLFLFNGIQSQEWMDFIPDEKKDNPSFLDIKKAYDDFTLFQDPQDIEGNKQYKRWEWYMQGRVNENGEFPSNLYWKEYEKLEAQRKENTTKNVHWTPVGPFNIPLYIGYGIRVGNGRVDCIAFHPTDENTFLIGSPAGGLWKTEDGGTTWAPLTDHLPSIGVADIAYHPNNPDIIYLATGERDAWNTFVSLQPNLDRLV